MGIVCFYAGRSVAFVCTVLLATASVGRAAAFPAKQLTKPNHASVPLGAVLRFWSSEGENFVYPGKQHPQRYDAILWGHLRVGGRTHTSPVLSMAVRRRDRFCAVQMLGRGMVGYTISDGRQFMSLLYDPRGGGRLLLFRTKRPLLGFWCGFVNRKSRPWAIFGGASDLNERAFVLSIWPVWFRAISRHCQRLSYDEATGMLNLAGPHKTSEDRITFAFRPRQPGFSAPRVVVSGVDRRVRSAISSDVMHFRLAANGLFPMPPNRMGPLPAQIAGVTLRQLKRSDLGSYYRAIGTFHGKMATQATLGHRRFLEWAVGQKEADVLDGWIYKGVAPVRPAKRTKAGGPR